MNTENIIAICQQLKAQGKEPSVALIKARLTTPTALPVIISGLKQWRTQPDIKVNNPEPMTNQADSAEQSLTERVEVLEQQVSALTQMIKQLQAGSD